MNIDRIRSWRGAQLLWKHRIAIYAAGILSLALTSINYAYGYAFFPALYAGFATIPIFLTLALSFIAPAMKMKPPSF